MDVSNVFIQARLERIGGSLRNDEQNKSALKTKRENDVAKKYNTDFPL